MVLLLSTCFSSSSLGNSIEVWFFKVVNEATFEDTEELADLQQGREMEQSEIVVSQFLNFTLWKRTHKTVKLLAAHYMWIIDSYNCLKMHDVAFGFDPHVSHVALREQQ